MDRRARKTDDLNTAAELVGALEMSDFRLNQPKRFRFINREDLGFGEFPVAEVIGLRDCHIDVTTSI